MVRLLAYKLIALKFIKFTVVGFSGLVIDFGITYLIKEKFKIQKYIANAIGFTVAASSNYYFNRIWTFYSTNPEMLTEYSNFLIVSVIGLGINSIILWLLVNRFKKQFYISKFTAIIVTTLWNFLANLMYTF